eukprot:588639-Prorocentrum_minimum.AAC.1
MPTLTHPIRPKVRRSVRGHERATTREPVDGSVCNHLAGGLGFPVVEWLNKGFMSVPHPTCEAAVQ